MPAQVLRGSKQEVAHQVAQLSGQVREAIVFIKEPPRPSARSARHAGKHSGTARLSPAGSS
jgi:hypothetical protein